MERQESLSPVNLKCKKYDAKKVSRPLVMSSDDCKFSILKYLQKYYM